MRPMNNRQSSRRMKKALTASAFFAWLLAVVLLATITGAYTSSKYVLSSNDTLNIKFGRWLTSAQITGTVKIGETLTVTHVASNVKVDYRWQSSDDGINFSNIVAATKSTYKIPEGMNAGGTYLRCVVTEKNAPYQQVITDVVR